ncbi:MAG: ParM/StbA family protein [Nitrospirota bacterium]
MKDGKDENGRRRRKQEGQDSKRPQGKFVGLDIGYGHTKIVTQDGEQVMFPSAVALVAPTAVQQFGAPVADDEVVIDRIRCIVGTRAIGKPNRCTDLEDLWWIFPSFKAIVTYASTWIPPQSTVITGLPLHHYIAPDARDIVHDLVKSILKAKRVLVTPQGVGAFYSDLSQLHATTKVAIVDIGTWTTELIAMTGNDFIGTLSTGVVAGVHDIYRTVAQELSEKLDRTVDPYEVERSNRGDGEIRAQGRAYAQSWIDERVAQLAKDRAALILAKMVDLWGDHAPDFESVLFCGGGAQLLFPYLKGYRDGAILMKNAQYANAVGFLKMGELLYGQDTTPVTDEPAVTQTEAGATQSIAV